MFHSFPSLPLDDGPTGPAEDEAAIIRFRRPIRLICNINGNAMQFLRHRVDFVATFERVIHLPTYFVNHTAAAKYSQLSSFLNCLAQRVRARPAAARERDLGKRRETATSPIATRFT